MKSYTHAGVSRLDGKLKVRYANSYHRVKILIKCGHKDIDLVELKYPSTKEDALAFLFAIGFANGNAEVQACLIAETKKRKVLNDIPEELEDALV